MAYKDTFVGSKHSREDIEKHFGKKLTEKNLGHSKSKALHKAKQTYNHSNASLSRTEAKHEGKDISNWYKGKSVK